MVSDIGNILRPPSTRDTVQKSDALRPAPDQHEKIQEKKEDRKHKETGDDAAWGDDVTSFSIQAIRLLLQQDPPIAAKEETAELLSLLSALEGRGEREISIRLGQPLLEAVKTALESARSVAP